MNLNDIRKFISGLRPVCVGIVTAHKEENSDVIRVSLKEKLTMDNGPIDSNKNSYDEQAEDIQGKSLSSAVDVEQIIEAVWIPHGDNHLMSSPNVRAGESVMIYKYADAPEWYWNTIFREPTLRRLENVLYAFSDMKDGFEPHTTESSYIMQWDTIRKVIRIQTAQSDGEQFRYTMEIDPGNNKVIIKDNVGNIIELDSPSNNISLTDVSGGRFESRDGFPKVTGPKGIEMEAPLTKVIGNFQVTGNALINGGLQANTGWFPGGHGWH